MNDEQMTEAINFYLLATKLKYKIRSGWDKRHWNVNAERIESVAEHVYGTCILAIGLNSQMKNNVDINKVLKMLVIHEIGEVIIGDITPFDNISREEKIIIEHQAVEKVLGDLLNKEKLMSLIIEFDERKTDEAKFAFYCDKLEADIQAKRYQDMKCIPPFSEQQNNVAFLNNKTQEMIQNGAVCPFDIWYLWDKDIYINDQELSKTLKYVKDNDMDKL